MPAQARSSIRPTWNTRATTGYRVCADISIVALQEARTRIGDHGLFVVADVAHLPFKEAAFDGLISLHTVHHLPQDEHLQAYAGLLRVLRPGTSGVIVNGWKDSTFTRLTDPLIGLLNRLLAIRRGRQKTARADKPLQPAGRAKPKRRGTFVDKQDATWLKQPGRHAYPARDPRLAELQCACAAGFYPRALGRPGAAAPGLPA